MSTTEAPRSLGPGQLDRHDHRELRLDPLLHGRGRVPGQRRRMFDLMGFVRARGHHDMAYQLACYAVDADIRVVDPDSPPPAARTIRGRAEIRSWLESSDALGVEVVHVVDGGDRVAFTESWRRPDGTPVLATSTAELSDGMITTQHTILVWAL